LAAIQLPNTVRTDINKDTIPISLNLDNSSLLNPSSTPKTASNKQITTIIYGERENLILFWNIRPKIIPTNISDKAMYIIISIKKLLKYSAIYELLLNKIIWVKIKLIINLSNKVLLQS
jgi:hypothetical protein